MSGGTKVVPILSTAGAIPVKNDKGEFSMQKVKVSRYVTGKRPDYAPDSSSEESEEDFEIGQKKKSVKHEDKQDLPDEEVQHDRRLRRLQQRQVTHDSDDEGRIARHRREVEEPEILQEGSDSDTDARLRRIDDEEDEEEEEELDEDEIERRRAMLRQRNLQRQEEEEVMDLEEEKAEGESEEETSEEEDYTDSEEEMGPRLKPMFVRKKDRLTIQEKEKEKVKQKALEIEAKKMAEERRRQTLKMIAEDNKREVEEERKQLDACDALDSGDENDEEEYESWKVRELKRLKRVKEEREALEKEKLEIDKLRNMTEEERRAELRSHGKEMTNKAPKGKYKFLQKYYHRGAFFMDKDEGVFQRDFSSPTLEDHFDKTILPKVMQVKNFGRSGRTKYTHLVDQDTTNFDSPWMSETGQNLKFQAVKGGGMKQVFDRPTAKKRK